MAILAFTLSAVLEKQVQPLPLKETSEPERVDMGPWVSKTLVQLIQNFC